MRVVLPRSGLLATICLLAAASTSCGYDRSAAGSIDAGGVGDGSTSDADPSAPDAVPVEPDAAVGIGCGGALCTGTQICCSAIVLGMVTQSCTEPAECQGQASSCDGPEDCGDNQICCESSGSGAACQDQGLFCQFELCHTASDCSDPGQICCAVQGRSACTSGVVCPGPPM
jgi:hypothetical protein